MPLRLVRALAALALLGAGRVVAQESATPPGQPMPGTRAAAPAPSACFPACREGFTCHQGQCISLCNPACPAGLECVEGRRCEPPLPTSRPATVWASASAPENSDASLGIGWNVGVLFGGALHFTPKFGLFAEVGWQQHRIEHSQDPLPDLDFKLRQACLNLGIVVRN